MSIYFDGSSYCYNNNGLTNINVSSFTASFWVKRSGGSAVQTLFTLGNEYNGNYRAWFRNISTSLFSPTFLYNFDSSLGQWATPAVSTGAWHHILVYYDRSSTSNDPSIYVDGILKANTEYNTPAGAARTGQDSVRFGSFTDGTEDFTGYIAEVGIWSGDKTSLASALAAGDAPSNFSTDLLQYWKMLSGDPYASEVNAAYALTASGTAGNADHPTIDYSSSSSSSSESSSSSSSSRSSSSSSSESSSSSSSESSSSSSESSSSSSSESSSSSSSESSSSSSESSSSSSSSESSSSSYSVYGYIWGAANPAINYTKKVWSLWCFKGTTTQARNTGDYGRLLVASGEEFVSDVVDMGSSISRFLRINFDKYNTGAGSGSIQWRGHDNTIFTKDDEVTGPAWEDYTESLKTWRYIQLKVTC